MHIHTRIRLSHLSQNEWAAPCLSASLIWMEELLADLTTLISTPMESVQYSCSWWNTLPGDATLPPQMIQQAEQRLSVMKGQWWEHLFPLWCASKKHSIRTRAAVVKSCNTWASYFQKISKLYRIMYKDWETSLNVTLPDYEFSSFFHMSLYGTHVCVPVCALVPSLHSCPYGWQVGPSQNTPLCGDLAA